MDEGLSVTGRLMLGYALRWGAPASIRNGSHQFDERFRRGAFAASIEGGKVLLCLEHDRSAIVARQNEGSLQLCEDIVGLRVEAMANNSDAGDDAIEAVRCRARAGLSVSFKRPRSEWATIGGVRQRLVVDCDLFEVSVVRNPAYRSSEISAGKMRIDRFRAQSERDNRYAKIEAAEAKLRT